MNSAGSVCECLRVLSNGGSSKYSCEKRSVHCVCTFDVTLFHHSALFLQGGNSIHGYEVQGEAKQQTLAHKKLTT